MEGKLCGCNCGFYTQPGNRFINGHNRRIKPISIPNHHLCECGKCGILVASDKRFIYGHNNHTEECNQNISKKLKGRISPMKNKFHTKETKEKQSIASVGKPKSKEHANNIGKASKRRWDDQEWRNKQINIIQTVTTENWRDPEWRNKNPIWHGGCQFEPYDENFNINLKNKIKTRFNNCCQNPLCNKISKTFDIHHINYNKKDSSELNLILLCSSCHSKTNFKRKEWEVYYSKIIYAIFTEKGWL